jgi:RNase P subunit RPR2
VSAEKEEKSEKDERERHTHTETQRQRERKNKLNLKKRVKRIFTWLCLSFLLKMEAQLKFL